MNISNTLCTQLWNHAVVDLEKKSIKVCCKTPEIIYLSKDDIEKHGDQVFLNLPQIRKDRELMLNGGKPERCSVCWNLEDSGNFSFRNGPNQWGDYFLKLNYEDYTYSYNPDNLDIQLGNFCDLKCIYCDEMYSSQWQTEKQKYGESRKHIPINEDNYEFEELFFSWFNKVKNNFKRIAFLGGEPLISPTFYKNLDRILNAYEGNFPEDLEINIISNLNTSNNYFTKFLETIQKYKKEIHFNINVSMESFGRQAEIIRYGLDFQRFTTNFEKLAAESGITLSIITTVNLLSLSTLHLFLNYVVETEKKYNKNIIIYPNLVSHPAHLQINLLEKELGERFVEQSIQSLNNTHHTDYVEFLKKLITKFKFEELKGKNQHLSFLRETKKLEDRRNINFREIFHEYQYLWK